MSDLIKSENDKLELLGRKRLSMSGVESVDGFTEQTLNLTVAGNKVKISGEGIKITAFNNGTGILCADGNFTEIRYAHKSVPVLKRLFK